MSCDDIFQNYHLAEHSAASQSGCDLRFDPDSPMFPREKLHRHQ